MATFKRFEDIKAWQKAREATKAVYEATADIRFSRDFGLRDQIQRATVSIMANIAEGSGRHSDREFANFLNIAHASVLNLSRIYMWHSTWSTSPKPRSAGSTDFWMSAHG